MTKRFNPFCRRVSILRRQSGSTENSASATLRRNQRRRQSSLGLWLIHLAFNPSTFGTIHCLNCPPKTNCSPKTEALATLSSGVSVTWPSTIPSSNPSLPKIKAILCRQSEGEASLLTNPLLKATVKVGKYLRGYGSYPLKALFTHSNSTSQEIHSEETLVDSNESGLNGNMSNPESFRRNSVS